MLECRLCCGQSWLKGSMVPYASWFRASCTIEACTHPWSLHAPFHVGLLLNLKVGVWFLRLNIRGCMGEPHTHQAVSVQNMLSIWAYWTTTSRLRLTRCSSKCCGVSQGEDGSVALVKPAALCGKDSDPKFNCKNALLVEQCHVDAELFTHAATVTLSFVSWLSF